MRLKNKVAIITGAGSGVGRATMVLFAKEGARVVGTGRRMDRGEETVALVNDIGGEAIFVPADVRVDDDAKRVVESAVNAFQRVDILINNASVGYSYEGSMDDLARTPEADWDDVVSINLKSVYTMSRHAIPQMRQAGGGAIVNVASVGGILGMADAHAYSAAKGGVIALTRSMCVAYGPENIRVNCLAPGGIDTPMIASRMAEINELLADPEARYMVTPLGKIGTPEQMAHALLYLASDEAGFTHGAVLVVDGGSTATL